MMRQEKEKSAKGDASKAEGRKRERTKGRRRENCLIALTRKLTQLLRES